MIDIVSVPLLIGPPVRKKRAARLIIE